ncbi:MAG: glycosyltransferase, partial [Planctomycetaceae bacterium]|nr:glycosyltransferase [Planctomycetaceae bacterium]
QPVCAWIFMVWFRPQVVNNPESTTAYANGAFMLMSRHCYESIDGFERVRGQLGEDVELARQAKSAGFRLRMLENRDLYQTRMYDTVKDSWRGWTRIFHGSLRSVPRLAASIAILSTVTLMPAALLAISLFGRLLAGPEQVAWWNNSLIAWGTVMALGHLTAVWFYRVVGLRGLWPLTYVAGTLITVAMLTDALLQQAGFRRTVWRGTSYQTTGTNAYRRAA